MANWVICAGGEQAAAIERYLRACDAAGTVERATDAWRLRSSLASGEPGTRHVVVGEGLEGPSAVNVAAAIVADRRVREVVLVVAHASGSLRSRAKRAGIARVVTVGELAVCGANPAPRAKGASGVGRARIGGLPAPPAVDTNGTAGGRAGNAAEALAGSGAKPRAGVGSQAPRAGGQADAAGVMGPSGQAGAEGGMGKMDPAAARGMAAPETVDTKATPLSVGTSSASGASLGEGNEWQGDAASTAGMASSPGEATGLAVPTAVGGNAGAACPGVGSTASGPKSESEPEAARREGVPVLCLVSGRGGVGKSTVAALMAHMASSWGMRVALLDLDLAFGNLFALCGLDAPADLTPVAQPGQATAERILACGRAASGNVTLWGPCALPEYAETVQPRAERLISQLTQGHDLVIVDTSSSWGDACASAAQAADRLVIVSDERPGAIASLARCAALAVRLGIARTRIVRLMNGCDPKRRDESFVARAAVGLETAREIRVADGGGEAVELLSRGHAAQLAASPCEMSSNLACGLAQLLKELGRLPENEAARQALGGRKPVRRLLRKMREAS